MIGKSHVSDYYIARKRSDELKAELIRQLLQSDTTAMHENKNLRSHQYSGVAHAAHV